MNAVFVWRALAAERLMTVTRHQFKVMTISMEHSYAVESLQLQRHTIITAVTTH